MSSYRNKAATAPLLPPTTRPCPERPDVARRALLGPAVLLLLLLCADDDVNAR